LLLGVTLLVTYSKYIENIEPENDNEPNSNINNDTTNTNNNGWSDVVNGNNNNGWSDVVNENNNNVQNNENNNSVQNNVNNNSNVQNNVNADNNTNSHINGKDNGNANNNGNENGRNNTNTNNGNNDGKNNNNTSNGGWSDVVNNSKNKEVSECDFNAYDGMENDNVMHCEDCQLNVDLSTCLHTCCNKSDCASIKYVHETGDCFLKPQVGILYPSSKNEGVYTKKNRDCVFQAHVAQDNDGVSVHKSIENVSVNDCLNECCKDSECASVQYRSDTNRCLLKSSVGVINPAKSNKTLYTKF